MTGRERWLVAATELAGVTAYTGGIGSHYGALLPALQRSGADVDLVLFSDSDQVGDPEDDAIRLRRYVRTDGMSRTAALGRCAQTVREVFGERRYARVFVPEWRALGSALPSRAPLLTNLATGMRLVHEVSGLELGDLPHETRLAAAVQMSLEERQIRRSAGLIAISSAMQARATAMFGPLPPARVVRNCVDIAAIRAAAVSAGLPSGWPPRNGPASPIVLFLGRAERRKGVVDAISAFGRLWRRLPSAHLVLAGAGGDARFEPRRADLLSLLPEHARRNVTWLGHVRGPELSAAIAASDVAMTPSRWEGFGNVALEVKAIGTPLVATSGSGFDDFCADGVDCLLVSPADPAALADALWRAVSDSAASRSRADVALRQVQAYAPDPVAADLRRAADELLGPATED